MTERGNELDKDYFAEGRPALMESHATLDVEAIAQALLNIYRENVDIDHDIEENLFRETKRIFDEAIAEGYADASEKHVPLPDEAFRDAFLHSADVFSAFRVHKMQRDIAAQMIDENGQLKPFSKFVKDVSPYIEHRNRAWLQTEYNTAIIRAQNAAEWQQFQEEKDVYPNLEWIQSTSPNPGADHMPFWGTVLPVDDPFWDEHKPGDRWNCKCELRQTDKQSTPVPVSDGKSDPAPGLESNPAKAQEVFSDNHPYYPDGCLTCPFAGNRLMALAHDLAQGKHCNSCGRVNRTIVNAEKSPNRREYAKFKKDKDYSEVRYDRKSGGVLAIHREHNFDSEIGIYGIPRGNYERNAVEALFRAGYSIQLRSEHGLAGVKQPDGFIDGVLMDIKGIEGGNPLYAMNRANQQRVHTAILYFHTPSSFSYEQLQESFENLPGWIQNKGYITDKTIYVKEIICIVNDKSGYQIHTIKNSEE